MSKLLQGKFAVEIINEATGGNADFVDAFDLAEDITEQKVKEVLRRARIPFAPVLLHDIKTVFEDEEEPRYFVSHGRISDRYRKKYGVRDSQIDQFTSPYGPGVACPAERDFFYSTEEWQDRAKIVRVMDRSTCRDCRCSDNQLHVHHEEHIYSAFSRRFYRNFDVIRLKPLCDNCHKKFHRSQRVGARTSLRSILRIQQLWSGPPCSVSTMN